MSDCAGNPHHDRASDLRALPAACAEDIRMTDADDDKECNVAAKTTHVDCQGLVDLLGDYVDEQLPGDLKAAVDGHMGQCAPCMAFLKQYRFAPQAVRNHLLHKVPVDLENRLLSFLKTKTQCKK